MIHSLWQDLIFPKHFHQLGTKEWNTWTYESYFHSNHHRQVLQKHFFFKNIKFRKHFSCCLLLFSRDNTRIRIGADAYMVKPCFFEIQSIVDWTVYWVEQEARTYLKGTNLNKPKHCHYYSFPTNIQINVCREGIFRSKLPSTLCTKISNEEDLVL